MQAIDPEPAERRSYLTTPIYYVNAAPHLGHAHTSVMGDILKRARQMVGVKVLLSAGTDEHGQKNEASARASGLARKPIWITSPPRIGRCLIVWMWATTSLRAPRRRRTWLWSRRSRPSFTSADGW